MENFDQLTELVPPPEQPLEVPSASDWLKVEEALGSLPTDYHRFIETYGTGLLDEFVWIFSPNTKNEYVNLEDQSRVILNGLAQSAREFPDVFTMPRHPEPGGFLPFGSTDNGDNLFWLTKGAPDDWTVVVMGPRSSDCYYHGGGMVDFLVKILGGEARCSIFPDDFPAEAPLEFAARVS